jgi:hypothetical protein
MTAFTGPGLLVSLPGEEIRGLAVSGSLVSPQEILSAAISPDLRSALHLIRREAETKGLGIKCVMRPEMFATGVSQAWLRARSRGISQHLCLSTGATVKHLQGFETSIFFYRRSSMGYVEALERLWRRAPESAAPIRAQINSNLSLGLGAGRVRPSIILLTNAEPLQHPDSQFWPFVFNRDSVEDSANRMRQRGTIALENIGDRKGKRYVILTETAMRDRLFSRTVAELVQRAIFDRAMVLILRLPSTGGGRDKISEGMAAIMQALRDSGILIPRIESDNVLVCVEDLEEDHAILDRGPLDILLHESLDFWRHTTTFYERAAQVAVFGDPHRGMESDYLPDDLTKIFGTKAVWC